MESKHKSVSLCLSQEICPALHLSSFFPLAQLLHPNFIFLPSSLFHLFGVSSAHFLHFPFGVSPSLPSSPLLLSPRSTELSVTLHITLFYHPFTSISPFVSPRFPPWALVVSDLSEAPDTCLFPAGSHQRH